MLSERIIRKECINISNKLNVFVTATKFEETDEHVSCQLRVVFPSIDGRKGRESVFRKAITKNVRGDFKDHVFWEIEEAIEYKWIEQLRRAE